MKLSIEITNGNKIKKKQTNADNGKTSTESLEIFMRTVFLIMS